MKVPPSWVVVQYVTTMYEAVLVHPQANLPDWSAGNDPKEEIYSKRDQMFSVKMRLM